MKTKLLTTILGALMFFFYTENKAQTKLLHYWHFNNTLPLTGGGGTHFGTSPLSSDYTRNGITHGALRYVKVPGCVKDTGYWDNNLGDSINQRIGYGGCCPAFTATTNNSSIRTRNPSDSMEFLWYIPTTNFKNIKINYETEASSTASGQHRQNFDYSLDSGATYINTGLPVLFDSAGTSWSKVTLNLSGMANINNSHKLIFRIRYSAPNTGGSGNNRYDNITVEGDSIVTLGVTEFNDPLAGYNLYPNPSDNNITIVSPSKEKETVLIKNIMGQIVSASEKSIEKNVPIDVSGLNKGIYYVTITEVNSKNTRTLKFVKN